MHVDVQVAESTEGYSGADLELLCREAAMRPVRRLMTRLQSLPADVKASASSSGTVGRGRGPHFMQSSVTVEEVDSLVKADPVTADDIQNALQTTKPSSDGRMER